MDRILIVNSIFKPEPGVSAQIGEALALKLGKLNYKVTILAPFPSRPKGYQFDFKYNKRETKKEMLGDNITLIRIPSYLYPGSNPVFRLLESISFGWATYKFIRRESNNIDKVYMNTWPIFGQFGVALASRAEKKPYFVHIQDVYPESFTNKLPAILKRTTYKLLFKIERYVVKNASRVIVISETMKQLIAKTRFVDENNISIVINWQDHNLFKDSYRKYNNDKFTFLYLGNIGPVAGIPFLIKAFAQSKINAKLIIAGSGSKKDECVTYASSFADVDIEFQNVPDGKVPEIQSQADVFLLPMIKNSASSSVPSKLPSYMFSGKPIIACVDLYSETQKCIEHAECGWVIEPENTQQLIDLFTKVIKLPQTEIAILGNNALTFGHKYFSKEINLSKLVNVIIK